MICKHCKNTINDNSIFCQYCGEKVTRAKRSSKETVSIPKPTVTPSGRFRGQLMYQNKRYFIIEDTEAAYYARGTAIKTGLIKEEKQTPKGTRLIDVIIKFITENEAVLSPTTVDSYYKITRVNFIGYMDMDVSKIPWQAMISNESRLKAPKTVRCAWGLVRTSLDYSKLSIPRVKLPKSCTNERDFLNYEQIQVFIKAINGNPYECVFLLALHALPTGLRPMKISSRPVTHRLHRKMAVGAPLLLWRSVGSSAQTSSTVFPSATFLVSTHISRNRHS